MPHDVVLYIQSIYSFEDAEGEWLKIRYTENGIGKICEIQRYSEQLKVWNDQQTETQSTLSRLSALSLSPNTTMTSTKQQASTLEVKEEKTESPPIAETGQISKGSSAYYLYGSTSKEEAEKYRPQKVEADSMGNHKLHGVKGRKGGSQWNNGATMEQFDYTELMERRVRELLINNVRFGHYNHDGDDLRIHEVTDVHGSATILLIRGKYREGWDISFECKWKGNVVVHDKRKSVKGTLVMNDISPEDAEEEWDYEVKVKKSSAEYRIAKSILEKQGNKQAVIDAVKVFIHELVAKKC